MTGTDWQTRYPISAQAIAALKKPGHALKDVPQVPSRIGPTILRPPPARVSRRARPEPEPTPERAAAVPGDVVDMLLVGTDRDQHDAQVHFSFREDVLRGAQLVMRRTPRGLQLMVTVESASDARSVKADLDALVNRLTDRGIVVDGATIVANDGDDKP